MAEEDSPDNQNISVAAAQDMGVELAAMAKISEAMNSLSEPNARVRVLSWAASAFGGTAVTPPPRTPTKTTFPTVGQISGDKEIPGIARVTQDGELHLTIRDLKARSANDAALRIVHLALLANERLSGSDTLSSKDVVVPMLRRYRAYDGNTRGAIAQHRGFARAGDQLSMDIHCKEEAEEFIRQILDPTLQGSWNPSAKTARKKKTQNPGDAHDDVAPDN